MARFESLFVNASPRGWTLAVYQQLPGSIGLRGVVWGQASAPAGLSARLTWEPAFESWLGGVREAGRERWRGGSGGRLLRAGSAWKVVAGEEGRRLEPAGAAPRDDHVVIHNVSGGLAHPTLRLPGARPVGPRDVPSGAAAQFHVAPHFWAALVADVVHGEVVESNVVVGPVRVEFPPGCRRVSFIAAVDETGRIELRVAFPTAA
jgi:hypothetical protein